MKSLVIVSVLYSSLYNSSVIYIMQNNMVVGGKEMATGKEMKITSTKQKKCWLTTN